MHVGLFLSLSLFDFTNLRFVLLFFVLLFFVVVVVLRIRCLLSITHSVLCNVHAIWNLFRYNTPVAFHSGTDSARESVNVKVQSISVEHFSG